MPDTNKPSEPKRAKCKPDFGGFRDGLWNAQWHEESDPQGYATMVKKACRDLADAVKEQPNHVKMGVLFVVFLGYVVLQGIAQKEPYITSLALGLFGGFGFLTLKGATDYAKASRQEKPDSPQL